MTEPYVHVSICIPTRDSWKADFGQSLAMAMTAFAIQGYELGMGKVGMTLHNDKGSLLPGQRMNLVNAALEEKRGTTHILWLDDDMRFPMTLIMDLLQRDVDIVGANCATKVLPPLPTAKIDGEHIHTTEQSTGLQEVDRVGCAVMLVKRKVFENIKQPWFEIPWSEEKQGYIGEDVFFCNKAREAGYKVHIDHDVSRQILHLGDFDYCHQMIEGYYDEKEKEQRVNGQATAVA